MFKKNFNFQHFKSNLQGYLQNKLKGILKRFYNVIKVIKFVSYNTSEVILSVIGLLYELFSKY